MSLNNRTVFELILLRKKPEDGNIKLKNLFSPNWHYHLLSYLQNKFTIFATIKNQK